jgi:hypothetical protein
MKPTVLCLLLGIAGLANADAPSNPMATEPTVSPLLDRCLEIAKQPLFDFPISREVGVPIDYQWQPPTPADRRVFGFMIVAMEAGQR